MVIGGFILLLLLIAYFVVVGQKYRLKADLSKVKKRAAVLEVEKQKLLRQLEKQKIVQNELDEQSAYLSGGKGEVIIIQPAAEGRYGQAQKIVEDLTMRLASLKMENEALKEKELQLNAEIANLSQENSILKAKLSSIPELKKAIKEVKLRMRKMSASLKSKTKTVYRLIEGNRGYLIKDGKTTAPARVRIEVRPAP